MLDFLMISTRSPKRGVVEIFPKFVIKKSNDLMIRGGDFYAIWVEERGLWSTDQHEAMQMIDEELKNYYEENKSQFDDKVVVKYMWDAGSGSVDAWHKYCQKQLPDNYKVLDETLIFANTKTKKRDYASKRLGYPLEEGDTPAWDRLMEVLYAPDERHKIEWAIGSVVTGDSKRIHKFMVLYGAAGTGKSTVLNIINQLFDGYTSVFDAKALVSSNNAFALEAFKHNPLVAIQHDGDLSRIEDNARLNSLVSHELMTVNEKFKSTYENRFICFLFMGTNKHVKITDAKSGLIRRLIDVQPTGEKIPGGEYRAVMKQVAFELGAIASKCRDIYMDDPGKYDDYIPRGMLGATNDFYNFVQDSWYIFKKENEITLKQAWEMYKTYCDDAKVAYALSQRAFKEELKNYFDNVLERSVTPDGIRVRSLYQGFKSDKFEAGEDAEQEDKPALLVLKKQKSIFDSVASSYPAQYANAQDTPQSYWEKVKTTLADLDTGQTHYVLFPEEHQNHIVIDFDIRGRDGEKNFQRNLEEASKWPATYAEVSKGGNGIHLHYIYTGDVTRLSRVYDDQIEIKLFTGKSSLRRRLSKCNNLPIATISSGLPLKEVSKSIDFKTMESEKAIRTMIKKNLNKEYHASTKPSIDFIVKILDDAYASGMTYDVSDLRPEIVVFAANSTNQSDACLKLVGKMRFKSEDPVEEVTEAADKKPIVFYDVEVFQNLFVVCWKKRGKQNKVVRMINPTASMVEDLTRYRLVGFNCRRYDNHILYAKLMGYDNMQLFNLSQNIINNVRSAYFGEAYNLSHTDIYDFSSKKQSLKKFEIELGLHHQELGLPWDQPVPEELWEKVAEYCENDVVATEATFEDRQGDFLARQILADVAGMTVNDTTNSLTTRIIFGKERKPQSEFEYRDLSQQVRSL